MSCGKESCGDNRLLRREGGTTLQDGSIWRSLRNGNGNRYGPRRVAARTLAFLTFPTNNFCVTNVAAPLRSDWRILRIDMVDCPLLPSRKPIHRASLIITTRCLKYATTAASASHKSSPSSFAASKAFDQTRPFSRRPKSLPALSPPYHPLLNGSKLGALDNLIPALSVSGAGSVSSFGGAASPVPSAGSGAGPGLGIGTWTWRPSGSCSVIGLLPEYPYAFPQFAPSAPSAVDEVP